MNKLLCLLLLSILSNSALQAQTKPACQELVSAINNAQIEITDGATTMKNVKMSIKECKVQYTFEMVAEEEKGIIQIDFSLEDIVSIAKDVDESMIVLVLYEGKEATSKLTAGGEVMEEKINQIPFKITKEVFAKIAELMKAAVQECNDAYLDLELD